MQPLSRHQIAWRAAQDLEEGTYVNLGLGMPTLIANYKPVDRDLMFHSENGIIGFGGLYTRVRTRKIQISSTRAARKLPSTPARRCSIPLWLSP